VLQCVAVGGGREASFFFDMVCCSCVAVALQCVAVFVWREETCAESGERSLSASIWFATDALQLCCSCVAVVCCSRCIV